MKIILSFVFSLLTAHLHGATIEVQNTQDSGEGSLRAALALASENDEDNTIIFSNQLRGETIFLSTPLEFIFDKNLVIKGFNETADTLTLSIESTTLFQIDFIGEELPTFKISDLAVKSTQSINTTNIPLTPLFHLRSTGSAIIFDGVTIYSDNTETTNSHFLLIESHPSATLHGDITFQLVNASIKDFNVSKSLLVISSNYNGAVVTATIDNTSIENIHSNNALVAVSAQLGDAQFRMVNNSKVTQSSASAEFLSIHGSPDFNEESDFGSGIELKDSSLTNNEFQTMVDINATRGNGTFAIENAEITENQLYSFLRTDTNQLTFSISGSHFNQNGLAEHGFDIRGDNRLIFSTSHSNFNDNSLNTLTENRTEFDKGIFSIKAGNIQSFNFSFNSINNNHFSALRIYSFSAETPLYLENSTIAFNDNSQSDQWLGAQGVTGDIYGGGIYLESGENNIGEQLQLIIENSTISGNKASVGGGIAILKSAQLTINNSTIANNEAIESGAGIVSLSSLPVNANPPAQQKAASDIQINNSIIANNLTDSSNRATNIRGHFTIQHSLLSDLQIDEDYTTSINGAELANASNISNSLHIADPLLLSLANNGGNTLTHGLSPNSPAIGKGNVNTDNLSEYDQRGHLFARLNSGRLDLGAIQFDGEAPIDDSETEDNDNETTTPSNDGENRAVGGEGGGGGSMSSFIATLLSVMFFVKYLRRTSVST